jgi:hypothetical protein
MKLKRLIIAVLVGATVLGAGAVAQSAFGSGTATPTQVIVERMGNGQARTWIVTSPEAVAALYRDVMGLPEAHLEKLMCPMIASLYTYRLTFQDGSDTVLVAAYDPGGCRTVQLTPGGTRIVQGQVGERFWTELRQVVGPEPAPQLP